MPIVLSVAEKDVLASMKALLVKIRGQSVRNCRTVRAMFAHVILGPRGGLWKSQEQCFASLRRNSKFAAVLDNKVGLDPATIAAITEMIIAIIQAIQSKNA